MKELFDFLDRKTAVTVAVVCLSFVILVAIIGGVGRTTYSPIIIENYFGLSADLAKRYEEATKNILASLSQRENPVGYGRTFSYDDSSNVPNGQTLLFYAREDQFVKIDVSSNNPYWEDKNVSANADGGDYVVSIDTVPEWPNSERPIGKSEEIKIGGETRLPQVTTEIGTDSHTVTIRVKKHSLHKELATFDCLILVQSRPF